MSSDNDKTTPFLQVISEIDEDLAVVRESLNALKTLLLKRVAIPEMSDSLMQMVRSLGSLETYLEVKRVEWENGLEEMRKIAAEESDS